MRRQLLTGLIMTLAMTVVVGFVYPLAVTAVGRVAFGAAANGSLVRRDGRVVGSSLIAQAFLDEHGDPDPHWFQPRPSAAGAKGYDPTASGASNLGPASDKLIGPCLPVPETDVKGKPKLDASGNPVYQRDSGGAQVCDPTTVPQRAIAYRRFNGLAGTAPVPVDAVTASASGLDPDISLANALDQAPRVARARHLAGEQVTELVRRRANGRPWGFLGERTVNVLDLNRALERLSPSG